MPRDQRVSIISRIQDARRSRILVYVTGDRRGLETKIASDIFPMVHRHLIQIGHQDKIDLFLYSTGGITIAGYALVNLIREFCGKFNVIIPFKALSCATLISLGADEVVMTPMGQLSPIDPSVEHPLGPIVQIPGQPARIAPMNVEDVNSFLDLAKKEFGLQEEQSLQKVFELLASRIHPVPLGAVHRSREQIAFLASNLMKYHSEDEEQIGKVTEVLIRQRFSHDYIISRKEAKETLKLNIVDPDRNLTDLVIELFQAYSNILELDIPFNPEIVLHTAESGVFTFNRAFIESSALTHVFKTTKEIRRVQVPQPNIPIPMTGYQERILAEGWVEDNQI